MIYSGRKQPGGPAVTATKSRIAAVLLTATLLTGGLTACEQSAGKSGYSDTYRPKKSKTVKVKKVRR